MANLSFPQLSTGALAQYPIRKYRLARTIKNILPDGSMILLSDPDGARLIWEMLYTNLSQQDMQALQNHFSACVGPYHAFTFIDPTDNMLNSSADLTAAVWQMSSLIQIAPGFLDPTGGTSAFTATNTGQANQQISQTLNVPSGYQYCFSFYATSNQPALLSVIRQGSSDEQSILVSIGPAWSRIVSSGQLNDSGATLSVGISLAPGQAVGLYGFQLEPQIEPSGYRPTQTGGVYANAHWGVTQLPVSGDEPNLYSTSFTIETAI